MEVIERLDNAESSQIVFRIPISKLHVNLTSLIVNIGGYQFNLSFKANRKHSGWHSLHLHLLASRDKRVSLPRDVKIDIWSVVNYSPPKIKKLSLLHTFNEKLSLLHTFSEPSSYGIDKYIRTAHFQDEDEDDDESCVRNDHIAIRANITLK